MHHDRDRAETPGMQPLEKVIGIHAVLEVLLADEAKIEQIYLVFGSRTERHKEIEERAAMAAIPVDYIAAAQITRLSGLTHHQGVMAMVRPHRLVDLQSLLQRATQRQESPFFLVIDQIQDPRNLGAVLRSAEAAGVHGVIMTSKRTSPLTPVALQASAGAAAHLDICRVVNLVQTLEHLKTLGFWIVGTDSNATRTIYDVDGQDAVAIVVGSEGQGMRRLVRETCDWIVSIPMNGKIDSLNVSVSAAITLFEIRRQRSYQARRTDGPAHAAPQRPSTPSSSPAAENAGT